MPDKYGSTERTLTRNQLVVKEILENNPSYWRDHWRHFCISTLARLARGTFTSFHPLQLERSFTKICDLAARANSISSDDGNRTIAAELAKPGPFRKVVKSRLSQSSRMNKQAVNQCLESLLPEKLNTVEANSILATVSAMEIYEELAQFLGRELYGRLDQGEDVPEKELLNLLCLMNYLQHWEIAPCKLLQFLSYQPDDLVISMPGIAEACSAQGTWRLPQIRIEQQTNLSIPEEWLNLSSLLCSLSDEAQAIAAGRGYMHRMLDINTPPSQDVVNKLARKKIPVDNHIKQRDMIYRQNEYYALLFAALAGLEFVIRSASSPNTASGGKIFRCLDELSPTLGDDLHKEIRQIFDTNQSNLRNRTLHGLFFDINARGLERVIDSGQLANYGAPNFNIMNRCWLPENVANHVIRLINETTNKLDATAANTEWTSSFALDEKDMQFVKSLQCDLFEDEKRMRRQVNQICSMLNDFAPCISTPLKSAIVGWNAKKHDQNLFPQIVFLYLLFEPLLRMVLLRLDKPILQRSVPKRGAKCCFQYQMLDQRGLLKEANLDRLTAGITDQNEQENAKRTLHLAAKMRDAMAHGAITDFTNELRVNQGLLIIKSIQLLSSIIQKQQVNTIPPGDSV